jgi:hypothetical protein
MNIKLLIAILVILVCTFQVSGRRRKSTPVLEIEEVDTLDIKSDLKKIDANIAKLEKAYADCLKITDRYDQSDCRVHRDYDIRKAKEARQTYLMKNTPEGKKITANKAELQKYQAENKNCNTHAACQAYYNRVNYFTEIIKKLERDLLKY